jgi:hypothetical protein
MGCLDGTTFFAAFNHGGGDFWQTPDAIVTSDQNRSIDPLRYDLFRRHVAGALAGTDELLIENARGADNGF